MTNSKFVDILIQIRRLKAAHELHSGVKGVEAFLPDGSGRVIVIPPFVTNPPQSEKVTGHGMPVKIDTAKEPDASKGVTASGVRHFSRPIPKIWNEWADLERSSSR